MINVNQPLSWRGRAALGVSLARRKARKFSARRAPGQTISTHAQSHAEYASHETAAVAPVAALPRDRSIPAFWGLAALFIALWTIVPTLVQPNLPLDSIEMLYWGREWQLGYYKHPPLPAWTAQITATLFGNAQWPIYFVAELAAVASFWAIWKLGREVLSPWRALAAVAVLQGCYQFNWATADINNNTITRPFWALAVLMIYWALTRQKLRYWIGYGLAVGVGLWSKYDLVCLGAGMTWLLMFNRDARRAWRTPSPYLAAAIIAVIFAPHVVWLVQNDFITLRYAMERADHAGRWTDHVVNPLVFCVKQLPVVLPVLLFTNPLVGWRCRLRKLNSHEVLSRDVLVGATIVPCVLVILLSAVTGASLRTGWTAQFWCYAGALFLFVFELKPHTDLNLKKTFGLCGAALAVSLLMIPAHEALEPLLFHKASRIHFPGCALAQAAEQLWTSNDDGPLPTIACSDWWVAANVSFYGPSRSSTLNLSCGQRTPWSSDDKLVRTGGVLVEPLDAADPDGSKIAALWRERFPFVQRPKIVTLPYAAPGELSPARFIMASIPSEQRLAARLNNLGTFFR
jgi:hypothetical protein